MATKTESQTQTTLLNVLQTARTELGALVERGIALAEKRTKSVVRARVTQGSDYDLAASLEL